MGVHDEYEYAVEWMKIYQSLVDVERDCEQMVSRLQLDRSLMFRIYHAMQAIRDRWIDSWASRLNPKEEGQASYEESVKNLLREENEWGTTMTQVKKMLVSSR